MMVNNMKLRQAQLPEDWEIKKLKEMKDLDKESETILNSIIDLI